MSVALVVPESQCQCAVVVISDTGAEVGEGYSNNNIFRVSHLRVLKSSETSEEEE